MKRILNTLYVTTQGTYLRKEGQSVVVQIGKEDKLRLPLISLNSIVTFGNVLCSPFLLGASAQHDISFCMLTEYGRYLGSFNGTSKGNVLLRRTQYRWADDSERCEDIVLFIILGKIINSRQVILRRLREMPENDILQTVSMHLKGAIKRLQQKKLSVENMRGIEGDCAKVYFGAFNDLISKNIKDFSFEGRTRRPPLSKVNAMLSFGYTLLYSECKSALEVTGLDSAVGFLHKDRPGRNSLALDLMEEMRAFWVDRLVLSLINRKQISKRDFDISDSGSVLLNDQGRKKFLMAWQKRKQDDMIHPFTGERIHLGLLPFLQAQLLARYIRGDLDAYPPFFWR